ncbi:MAG: hypothetical protein LBI19_07025 [Oscillospiraceae bacterium]|nr:hypothetical protein [Oscillospiraceae bacterium]
MNGISIVPAVLWLLLWAVTIVFLLGHGWAIKWIFCITTAIPKEEKEKYKQSFDIVKASRFIGIRFFLPIFIVGSIGIVRMYITGVKMDSSWIGIAIGVVAIASLGYGLYSFRHVFSDRFRYKR